MLTGSLLKTNSCRSNFKLAWSISGGIAHDFNNILAIIAGNAEMAMAELTQISGARPYLKEIASAARKAKTAPWRVLTGSPISSNSGNDITGWESNQSID